MFTRVAGYWPIAKLNQRICLSTVGESFRSGASLMFSSGLWALLWGLALKFSRKKCQAFCISMMCLSIAYWLTNGEQMVYLMFELVISGWPVIDQWYILGYSNLDDLEVPGCRLMMFTSRAESCLQLSKPWPPWLPGCCSWWSYAWCYHYQVGPQRFITWFISSLTGVSYRL